MNVLIVEDDVICAKAIRAFLGENNCDTDVAYDVESALELYYKNKYDLIFMDIGLPDLEGICATKMIRKHGVHGKDVPIIAITAHANDETQHDALRAGANEFMLKPATPRIIRDILHKFAKIKNVKRTNLTVPI